MVSDGSIRVHMVPYGPHMAHMVQMGPFVLYGPTWSHMVSDCSIWSQMAPYKIQTRSLLSQSVSQLFTSNMAPILWDRDYVGMNGVAG